MFNLHIAIQQDFPDWEPSLVDRAEILVESLAANYNLREDQIWNMLASVIGTLPLWRRTGY